VWFCQYSSNIQDKKNTKNMSLNKNHSTLRFILGNPLTFNHHWFHFLKYIFSSKDTLSSISTFSFCMLVTLTTLFSFFLGGINILITILTRAAEWFVIIYVVIHSLHQNDLFGIQASFYYQLFICSKSIKDNIIVIRIYWRPIAYVST